jgi:hypothetical protein
VRGGERERGRLVQAEVVSRFSDPRTYSLDRRRHIKQARDQRWATTLLPDENERRVRRGRERKERGGGGEAEERGHERRGGLPSETDAARDKSRVRREK